jgi:FAD/FMN-containing dehydrogenase
VSAPLDELRAKLTPGAVLEPADGLERYERSVLFDRRGQAAFAVRPKTVDDVRSVVRWAVRHRVRLVAQGANSGLVDAGLPDASGEMGVLSLELCRERLDIDPLDRTVTASAGWDLDGVNDRLAAHGLRVPVDVGSNPLIGGMISTNTGGTNVVRYGDVRRLTRGVQVVVADEDATVLDLLAAVRKNNAGLDLKQLFIGAAGTLGIVTAATMDVAVLPRQRAVAWVGVSGDRGAFALLQVLERRAGELLTSFEMMSGRMLQLRARHKPDLRQPFPLDAIPPLALLIELSSTIDPASGLDVAQLLAEIIGAHAADGTVIDAVFGPPEQMWAMRHGIDETAAEGYQFWVDVCFARSAIADFRARFDELLDARYPGWEFIDLGHYGDGGLHAAGMYPFRLGREPPPEEVEALRGEVYELVSELGGSFSAEHGIGPSNAAYYHAYTPTDVQRLSGRLKAVFDPHGILGVTRFGTAAPG